jgi:uncharacterized membrane protein YfcA
MLPDYPPAFWLCAVLAMIIFGISKAGFGGGIGVIATPLVSLTIPVTDAVALLDAFPPTQYQTAFAWRPAGRGHRWSFPQLLSRQ